MGTGLAVPALAQTIEARRPNIVFLLSDDHSVPDLGCYGNRSIRTPNLDRLASEGKLFHNCFVTSPQCSPNRSTLLTGATPHTIATSRLHTPMPPWEKTVVDHFKDAGYFTGAFRKVHQGAEFNKRFHFYGGPKESASAFFDRIPKQRPFFLHFGFTDPHRPYKKGVFAPPHSPQNVQIPSFLPDLPAVREDLAMYYDAIARMDAEVGDLLTLLKQRGLDNDTVIVFTGDNGMPFPGAKGTCYDPGLRVPLIVHWPGKIQAAEHRELISHADLAPTMLDIGGAAPLPKMQGRSFFPLLLGGDYQPNEAVFSERNWHDNFDPIRSVRTATHKLIFNAAPHFPYRPAWDLADSLSWNAITSSVRRDPLLPQVARLLTPTRPVLELYDLKKDPDEISNLATSPSHAKVLAELQGRLSQWMHATYDYLPPSISAPDEPPGRSWPVSL